MRTLNELGKRTLDDLARRYEVGADAVSTLLRALTLGNGTMAQFNHVQLGGAGQWMQGGMTMIGDMSNPGLKAKVDGLCTSLSRLMNDQAVYSPSEPTGGSGSGSWWPSGLGSPNSSGGQNDVRYAYFAEPKRLAVDVNGKVTVYDTGDHKINGVSQQQGSKSSLTFTSQHGDVDLSSLPVVSGK